MRMLEEAAERAARNREIDKSFAQGARKELVAQAKRMGFVPDGNRHDRRKAKALSRRKEHA